MMDPRYANRHLPTITLYLWPCAGLEYWYSSFPPTGLPERTWFEPIEDEM